MNEIGFQNAETGARTMKFIGKMFGVIVCAATVAAKSIDLKRKERARNRNTSDIEGVAALAIFTCFAAGFLSGVGGLLKGAPGQFMGLMGDLIGLGGSVVALYFALAKLLGGVNFTSQK